MKYSVWNARERAWDHYEAPGALRDGVFAEPPPKRSAPALGLTPEEAARPLPIGARLVGRSDRPVGLVANRKSLLGMALAGVEISTLIKYGAIGAAGYFLWRSLR